jgi:hypothetical protein
MGLAFRIGHLERWRLPDVSANITVVTLRMSESVGNYIVTLLMWWSIHWPNQLPHLYHNVWAHHTLGWSQQLAAALHSMEKRHSTDLDRAEVANIQAWSPCIIKGAWQISEHPGTFNLKDGYRLSTTWLHISPHTLHSPLPLNNSWMPPSFSMRSFLHLFSWLSGYRIIFSIT